MLRPRFSFSTALTSAKGPMFSRKYYVYWETLRPTTICHHPLRLRLLIASRPEPHIRENFDSFPGRYDSVEINQSFADVRNYLRKDEAGAVAEARESIASITNHGCGTNPVASFARSGLILHDVPFQSRIIAVLCVIIHGSIMRLSRINIEKLLGLDPGDLARALWRLHSLVLAPPDETDLISLHHKSFRDFLLDPNRSGGFYLGQERCKELARSILRALSQSSALISSTHVAWHGNWLIQTPLYPVFAHKALNRVEIPVHYTAGKSQGMSSKSISMAPSSGTPSSSASINHTDFAKYSMSGVDAMAGVVDDVVDVEKKNYIIYEHVQI
ncbi:hypothetical protein DFH09DRAFT_1092900 [Mycena vulgaris]|nr:hypothetical protein DFH09DRAFT_1092900 [Mycena vulgaris]